MQNVPDFFRFFFGMGNLSESMFQVDGYGSEIIKYIYF